MSLSKEYKLDSSCISAPYFNMYSFVELAIINTVPQANFGCTVLIGNPHDPSLKISASFDLTQDLESMGSGSYLVLGNPKLDWRSIPITFLTNGQVAGKSIIYAKENEWIDYPAKSFLSIIVTKSLVEKISDVWPVKNGFVMPHLEKDANQRFYDYLKRNQEDAIIIQGAQVNRKRFKLIDTLIMEGNLGFIKYPVRYIPTSLGFGNPNHRSLNRCFSDNPFDQSVYALGDLTPGNQNDCEAPPYVPNLPAYHLAVPKNDPLNPNNVEYNLELNDAEMMDLQEDAIFDAESTGQSNNQELVDDMYNEEANLEGSSCLPINVNDRNAGKEMLQIAKSVKIQKEIEGHPVESLLTKEEEWRKISVEDTVLKILRYQNTLFDTTLVERNGGKRLFCANHANHTNHATLLNLISIYLGNTGTQTHYSMRSPSTLVLSPTQTYYSMETPSTLVLSPMQNYYST